MGATRFLLLACFALGSAGLGACSREAASTSPPDLATEVDGAAGDALPADASLAADGGGLGPTCSKPAHTRLDLAPPQTVVSDWRQPVRLGAPINTPCPEDAIEISADGSRVYFHSFRRTNTGFLQNPPRIDILDIYVADLVDGRPGPGSNLGPPVNSEHADGEHAIHPDGVSLYFASSRPDAAGQTDVDLWVSRRSGSVWQEPVNLAAINSERADQQPSFSADGKTMHFASERDPSLGMAIYRTRSDDGKKWQDPELVVRNAAGEPSLTADGELLYFVHVLLDAEGIFDADIWYLARNP